MTSSSGIPPAAGAAAEARHRSAAVPLALACTALIVYASLYPFEGWYWPGGRFGNALFELPWHPYSDRFDIWSNIAAYVPLGFLVFAALSRSGVRPLAAFAATVAATSLLSYVMETLQHLLPPRQPSLKDWVDNTAGGVAGAALGAALLASGGFAWLHRARARWFPERSSGGVLLLAVWPAGLLFPTPMPLGLGQVGPKLREWLAAGFADVPWALPLHDLLAGAGAPGPPAGGLTDALASALGMLAPSLLAYAMVPPGLLRLGLPVGALALAVGVLTLATLLNFGPEHALAWNTPLSMPAMLAATAFALLLAPVPRRLAAGLALVVLTGLVVLVAQAPTDPYFALNLQAWEQGRFVRFHGLAQWVGWLWPYAAIGWLLARLARP